MISLRHLNHQKALVALGLVTLGLVTAPTQAQATSITRLTDSSAISADGKNKYDIDGDGDYDDYDFERQMDRYSDNIAHNDGFKELFVAEGRIGNNSLGTAERELGINRDVRDTAVGADGKSLAGKPVDSKQFIWGNGSPSPLDFVLEYDGKEVKYTIGNPNYTVGTTIVGKRELTATIFTGPVNDIFFRTRAASNSAANNSKMSLTDLVYSINGTTTALGDLFSQGENGSSDLDYLRLSGVSAGFKVMGKASMSWTGTRPNNSALAFQIKVGNSEKEKKKVPEPTALSAIVLAGIAIASSKRKKGSEAQA